jgi:molybdenum cofactor synthesis domain-containing protein
MRATVVTVSDEVASGADTDRGGPVAVALLQDLGWEVDHAVAPDDPDRIAAAIQAATNLGSRLVLACGGTGIGPRDHSAEVVRSLVAFEIPGIAEEIRRQGLAHTAQALISREIAGVIAGHGHPPVLVLAVPGSRGGVRDAIGVVGAHLGHIIEQLDGAGHT